MLENCFIDIDNRTSYTHKPYGLGLTQKQMCIFEAKCGGRFGCARLSQAGAVVSYCEDLAIEKQPKIMVQLPIKTCSCF